MYGWADIIFLMLWLVRLTDLLFTRFYFFCGWIHIRREAFHILENTYFTFLESNPKFTSIDQSTFENHRHTKNTSITEILQDSKDTSRTYTHIFRLMDDDVDYESLGGKYPMSVNAAAGAIAGYFEVKCFIVLAIYKYISSMLPFILSMS